MECPYIELVWVCFIKKTHLVHTAAYLEYSKFTNIRTRLRKMNVLNAMKWIKEALLALIINLSLDMSVE